MTDIKKLINQEVGQNFPGYQDPNIGRIRFKNVRIITASCIAKATDEVLLCNATSGAITVTLPPAKSVIGKHYIIKKIDTSSNAVTVDGAATETIDDLTTQVLSYYPQAIRVISDGTEWWTRETMPVVARYQSDAGQSIANASYVRIDFEDQIIDTHSAVTTGSSWKFTAPVAGLYLCQTFILTGQITIASGEMVFPSLHYNGGSLGYATLAGGNYFVGTNVNVGVGGSTIIKLNKDDYVHFSLFQATGGSISLTSTGANCHCSITLLK